MDILQIRNLSDDQLYSQLDTSFRELMNLRFRASTRQLGNPGELGRARKVIARIKTVMRQRGLREK